MLKTTSFKVGDRVKIRDVFNKQYSITGDGSIGKVIGITNRWIEVLFSKNSLKGPDALLYNYDTFKYNFFVEELEIIDRNPITHLPEYL